MRRRRGTDELLLTLQRALVPPARPNPMVLLWRWRYEIGFLVGGPPAVFGLAGAIGTPSALGLVIAMVSMATGLSWPRRRLVARGWCVVTPHRIRAVCAQRRLSTRRGRLPAVLWCAPRTFGELVVLWCPAGLDAADLHAERDALAAGCYAHRVEVRPHDRHRNIVFLAVVRRTPS